MIVTAGSDKINIWQADYHNMISKFCDNTIVKDKSLGSLIQFNPKNQMYFSTKSSGYT